MEGCTLASAVLTLEIHFTSKVNTVNASGEALTACLERLHPQHCRRDGVCRMALRQAASCAQGRSAHTGVIQTKHEPGKAQKSSCAEQLSDARY